MAHKKVSIIGAGNVGATVAYYVAEKVIADIVMVDVPSAPGVTSLIMLPSEVLTAKDSEYFLLEKRLIQAGGANLGF